MIDAEVFTQVSLFASLRPDDVDVLRRHVRPLAMEAGEVLIEQGVTTLAPLIIMTEGLLEVSRTDEQGNKHTLALLEPPTVVGEMEFLANVICSATVTALDDVKGVLLPRQRFEQMLAADEPAAFHLAVAIGRLVSERLAATNELFAKAAAKQAVAAPMENEGLPTPDEVAAKEDVENEVVEKASLDVIPLPEGFEKVELDVISAAEGVERAKLDVIPAHAGIQRPLTSQRFLDSRVRGNDELETLSTPLPAGIQSPLISQERLESRPRGHDDELNISSSAEDSDADLNSASSASHPPMDAAPAEFETNRDELPEPIVDYGAEPEPEAEPESESPLQVDSESSGPAASAPVFRSAPRPVQQAQSQSQSQHAVDADVTAMEVSIDVDFDGDGDVSSDLDELAASEPFESEPAVASPPPQPQQTTKPADLSQVDSELDDLLES